MPDISTRKRRKAARPGEIAAAALEVFGEKGFAAARMEDIAARAGVSKGVVYLYFKTKQDVFHAVVMQAAEPKLAMTREAADRFEGGFEDFLGLFVPMIVQAAKTSPLGRIAKMVIGESRNFPDLARDWHDSIVEPMVGIITQVIARAQARGEVRAGDARLMAFEVIGPLFVGILWRETFTPVGAPPVDLERLGAQHLEILKQGLKPGGGA